ncbi:hypothetical protein [Actinomadura sp. 7K507]|uniref:hypothetical protein n=1 Tax=Actinomadura sp. 7K507 TaxID=2530365 RepID=UPI00104EA5A5|nr:hypothetical protein [Actinomadura sp. 7K507]TDC85878.1 hypothetical protein E1285_24350 [Actinomadura sp. 7K507]
MKRALLRAAAAGAAAVLAVSATAQPASADTWRKVDLPFLWPGAGIRDISAAASDNVWIAGVQGSFCIQPVAMWPCVISSSGNPVVRHWDGSRWREYPINGWGDFGADAAMRRVVVGGGETWIYGGSSNSYLAAFNGRAFDPSEPPGDGNLVGLHGGAAGVWARMGESGGDALYRRAGGAWVRTPVPADLRYVNDIQARTPTDAWAVGQTEPSRNRYGVPDFPAIAHWDGSSWTSVPAHTESGAGERLIGVAPVGAGEVWAITRATLLHWDGATWTTIPGPPGMTEMRTLAADDTGTPWAIMRMSSYEFKLFRHGDGAWQEVQVSPTGTVTELDAVPGTGELWATGGEGRSPAVFTDS